LYSLTKNYAIKPKNQSKCPISKMIGSQRSSLLYNTGPRDISIKTILKARVTLYTIEMKYLLIAILLLGAVSAQAYDNDDVEASFENDLGDLDTMTKDMDFDNEDDFLEDAQDEEDPMDFEDDMEDEDEDSELEDDMVPEGFVRTYFLSQLT